MAELVDVPGVSQMNGSYRQTLCELAICVTMQASKRPKSSYFTIQEFLVVGH